MALVRSGETSFANSDTGTREGVPFGSITAQRGDRFILDDPHSTAGAESEAERNATTRQFLEGALNRLNDQAKSAIVVIMQRLHEADVSGVILARKMNYMHLCLPMEFEADRRCITSIGFKDPREVDGELADPERFGPLVRVALPINVGDAGKFQNLILTRALSGFIVVSSPETGKKAVRAEPFAAQVNVGNVSIVAGDWVHAYVDEMRTEWEVAHDDQIDAGCRASPAVPSAP